MTALPIAEPWLPADALQPAHFEQLVSRTLEEWSSHWFKKARATCRTRLREVGAISSPVLHWMGWGQDCAIGTDEAGRLALAEAMLGRPIGANAVQPADRPLLEDLARQCLEDLAGRISWLIEHDRSPEIVAGQSGLGAGMSWEIGLRRGATSINLSIGRSALVRWRKSLAPKSAPPALGRIRAALGPTRIELGLKLGQCALRLAELEGLGAGDVVILNTEVGSPLSLIAADRETGLKAKLADEGEGMGLHIIEKKKVAS